MTAGAACGRSMPPEMGIQDCCDQARMDSRVNLGRRQVRIRPLRHSGSKATLPTDLTLLATITGDDDD